MKKTYLKPTVVTVNMEGETILAASDVSVYSTSADKNKDVLADDLDLEWDEE